MMLSATYRELNRDLHKNPDFGISGQKYAGLVRELVQVYGTRDILDYGCGKCTLETSLGFDITNYDPCLPGYEESPRPHAIVVCTDVLEHIEPDCLTDVLKDLRRVTQKVLLATNDTRPAHKTLADGRNAHLIIEKQAWWLPRLWQAGFEIRGMTDSGNRIKLTAI